MDPRANSTPYFGHRVRSLSFTNAHLIEAQYGASMHIAEHVHDSAYLSLVIKGTYTECVAGSSQRCVTGTAIFHPSGERHADLFDNHTSRIFMIEPSQQWLHDLQSDRVRLEGRTVCRGTAMSALAGRIYDEMRATDPYSALVVEGLLLELAGIVARTAAIGGHKAPPWLLRVRERLLQEHGCSLRIKDLASAEGVSSAELARSFRRHFGSTAGDFLRRERIESASRLLRTTRIELASVALESGFANQSHFCRWFRHYTGTSPMQYRKRHQSS